MPEGVLPRQTSAGLGYSSVGAAEWHCAGLSLQIDNQVKFEKTLKARLLWGRYFVTNHLQSSPFSKSSANVKNPHSPSRSKGFPLS